MDLVLPSHGPPVLALAYVGHQKGKNASNDDCEQNGGRKRSVGAPEQEVDGDLLGVLKDEDGREQPQEQKDDRHRLQRLRTPAGRCRLVPFGPLRPSPRPPLVLRAGCAYFGPCGSPLTFIRHGRVPLL